MKINTNLIDKTDFITDTYSTSTEDTYSCNYVNEINTYSTSETLTGEYWIDGKPVYRIVIETTVSQVSDAISNLNIDYLIDMSGSYAVSKYTSSWPIPNTFNSENEYDITVMGGSTPGNGISISFGSFYNDGNVVVLCLKYTKTTD